MGHRVRYRLGRREGRECTAVVRVRERLHLGVPDHETDRLLIGWLVCANPGWLGFGHDERKKEACDISLARPYEPMSSRASRTFVKRAPTDWIYSRLD